MLYTEQAGTSVGTSCRKGTPPGAKLRRGYLPPKPSDKQVEIDVKQEEVDNYCARVPVNRLVLACHGIGQKLAVSNIAHDAACMRFIMRQLSQVLTQIESCASFYK